MPQVRYRTVKTKQRSKFLADLAVKVSQQNLKTVRQARPVLGSSTDYDKKTEQFRKAMHRRIDRLSQIAEDLK